MSTKALAHSPVKHGRWLLVILCWNIVPVNRQPVQHAVASKMLQHKFLRIALNQVIPHSLKVIRVTN